MSDMGLLGLSKDKGDVSAMDQFHSSKLPRSLAQHSNILNLAPYFSYYLTILIRQSVLDFRTLTRGGGQFVITLCYPLPPVVSH